MMRRQTVQTGPSFDFAQDEPFSQTPADSALMLSEVEARVRARTEGQK